MSSDSEDEAQGTASSPKKRKLSKQKHRKQKFRVEWERDPEFSTWLKPDDNDPSKAKCIWCNSSLTADISVIKLHKNSKKHQKVDSARGNTSKSITQNFFKQQGNSLERDITDAEIKISGFIAAHNIPFSVIDDLIPCLKSALPDSKILEGIRLKRLKATKVVTNVIGATHKEEIANLLKKTKFSVLTDDSTDGASVKTACVVVRFYNEELGRVTSLFWDLQNVFPENDDKAAEEGATASRLYDLLLKSFHENNIPLENIIGFGCDGASVNVGVQNSISSRLKNACPGIVIMKCVCHSLHLASSKACELHMPRSCEDLARNVHNYVQHSAKRVASLAVFQKFLNISVHKILHPAQTRWLSLLSVNERMLEQWEALRLYFMEQHLQERTLAAESIYRWLCDPFVKLFYFFLAWILPKVTKMNAYFQSESVLISSLASKMEIAFKEILSTYLVHDYVNHTPLNQLKPDNSEKYLPIKSMYLGVQVMEALKKPEIISRPGAIDDFFLRCRSFLIKLAQGIQDRFDFDDPVLTMLPILQPSIALSIAERNNVPSLLPLCDSVVRAKPRTTESMQRLDDEWRRLPLEALPEDIVTEKDIDVFWHKIGQLEDSGGEKKYIELPTFAVAALSLPHSNAQCERVFSKYNLIKTKIRNRLVTKHVEGCMLTSQVIKMNKGCCHTFKPTQAMRSKMVSKTLYDNSGNQNANTTDEDTLFNFVFEEV